MNKKLEIKKENKSKNVVSIIKNIVRNHIFIHTLKQVLNNEIDISNIKTKKKIFKKRRRQIECAKNKWVVKMDLLAIDTPSYHIIYDDMEKNYISCIIK